VITKEPDTGPKIAPGACAYCADAPLNHTLSYWSSFLVEPLDDHMIRTSYRAPKFLKRLVDFFVAGTFGTLTALSLAKFSGELERAKTFRSRVIWEEAKRRGIKMEQLILFGKPLDHYRALLRQGSAGQAKRIYFESLPVPEEMQEMQRNWDDKFLLKREFLKHNIPAPRYALPKLWRPNLKKIFSELEKPLIVKPKLGSRGRHTLINIRTLKDLERAVEITREITPNLIIEEQILGDVCRATLVRGRLAGFYRGRAPDVVGDGIHTIAELITAKDASRPERVEKVRRGAELESHLLMQGYELGDVLPDRERVTLSHRIGRLFGGSTREMIEELHPSFVPIFEKAAKVTGLAVVGFDAIIPDPTAPAESERWGIIEANTLPFIDLHYYALEGKPKNIAGMIWDLWK